MAWLVAMLLAAPAQTIAGKYVQHSEEYERARPRPAVERPDPLPADVAGLCALIEAGHDDGPLFAALGEALLADGRGELAYRAFHRAYRARDDDEWRQRMQARKAAAAFVPDEVIFAEEREAVIWVAALQRFERRQLLRGADPDDLAPFFAHYGRPEESLAAIERAWRVSFAGGVVGLLFGVAFLALSSRARRRAAFFPLAIGLLCVAGPALAGRVGLFPMGAVASLLGAAAVGLRGRRAA